MSFWEALFGRPEDYMFTAIVDGNTRKLTTLLDKGCSPNTRFKDTGMSPLSLAVQDGNAEIVALLLQRGARVNKRDGSGELPLSIAVLNAALDGYVGPVVSVLLDNGADVNLHGKSGANALQIAATSGAEKLVRLLLDHGADVNSGGDLSGFTPLMGAADRGHVSVVEALLKSGADPSLTDADNQSALSFAEEKGHADCIEMLRAATQTQKPNGDTGAATGGASRSEADVNDAAASFSRSFSACIADHVDRMASSEHVDAAALRSVFYAPALTSMADIAGAKMALTAADGQSHSALLGDGDTAVAISTFQGTISDAAAWYRQEGGYVDRLNRYLNSDAIRDLSSDSFCYITFGFDGLACWVNMSMVSLAGRAFKDAPILATDLMSESERAEIRSRLICE